MAGFVAGDAAFFFAAEDALFLLGSSDQAFDALLELGQADVGLAAAGREQGCLVDEVGQISAHEAGSHGGDLLQVDRLVERDGSGMDLEDLLAADQVGPVDHDLPVEPAGTHESRVKRFGAVGRGQQDDAPVGVEAVHLDQKLIERLIALVVAAWSSGAPGLADGVELVDEDQARRPGLGFREQVAHARSAHTDEQLDEIGPGKGEKGHARLAGHGAGQQRLAGARRADQEDALGNAAAQRAVFLRRPQEINHLAQLGDDLIMAGDVVERNTVFISPVQVRPAARKGHGRTHAAGARDHPGECHQHDDEDRPGQHHRLKRRRRGVGFELASGNVGVEQPDEIGVLLHAHAGNTVTGRPVRRLGDQQSTFDQRGPDLGRGDFSPFKKLAKLAIGQGLYRCLTYREPSHRPPRQPRRQSAIPGQLFVAGDATFGRESSRSSCDQPRECKDAGSG